MSANKHNISLSNLRFFPNSPPLTTNHHGGQRPPPGAPPAGPPVPQHRSTSLQPICFQTYHSTSANPQSQGPQVMLSLRWNQFENQSLSAPVRAHGLRRQVRQSLRSIRSNSKSHLSILLSVISKNKNEIEFRRECPPSLTARQHGGQRPPVGAPRGAPPAPPPVPQHCPTSLKPFAFRPTTRRVM